MQRVRRSKQRDYILDFLRGTEAHPTAQHIYEVMLAQFPSLSLGTVYRNLNILEEQGLVRRLQYGSTFDRYDADIEAHYHFICRVCGRIYDLPISREIDIEDAIAESMPHRVEDHTVELYGTCERCLGSGESEDNGRKMA